MNVRQCVNNLIFKVSTSTLSVEPCMSRWHSARNVTFRRNIQVTFSPAISGARTSFLAEMYYSNSTEMFMSFQTGLAYACMHFSNIRYIKQRSYLSYVLACYVRHLCRNCTQQCLCVSIFLQNCRQYHKPNHGLRSRSTRYCATRHRTL